MESGGGAYGGSDMNTSSAAAATTTQTASGVLLKTEMLPCSSEVLDSLWISNSSDPSFHGSTSMVNFEEIRGENMTTERPFFTHLDKLENGNEDYDGCFHQPEKKRRLAPDQVQFLEKSFEVENKLEPERKIQLAKELGLQPRQVAIWFQNRRARYKTKQLEKEYDSLKGSYDELKADYDILFKENEELRNEVRLLSEKLVVKDKGKEMSEPCDSASPLDTDTQNPITTASVSTDAPLIVCKQEDASSAKSDVYDSDSPHCTDGNQSSLLEPTADSSHAFEPDQSDFSQDEDDNLSKTLFPSTIFPKLEDECYNYLQLNSCNPGFPVEDQPSWFWSTY